MIVRAKYANTLDWRQGQRLGKNDRLVTDMIRRLMLESSLLLGTPIERQSFKGTVDTLRAWRETLAAPGHASQREDVLLDMLLLCALDQLPHRPGRHQPRAVKRRPKSYQLLTRHRRLFTESPSRQNTGQPRTKSKRHSTVLSA